MRTVAPEGRYCKYLRKSRADEAREALGEGETLARHDRILDELADRMGITVSRTYREVVSGDSIADRPQMRLLLDALRRGEWDGVLTVEVERLSRGDATDQGIVGTAFSCSGALIITPQKVYDPAVESDMEYFEYGLFMSRREYKSITRRMVQGKEAAVREGQYLGSIAPFGWRKVDVARKHTIEPDAMHGELVGIYRAIASGATASGVASDLNLRGVPTPRGGHWDCKTVKHVVRNITNIGYVRWNARKTVTALDEGMRKVKRKEACARPMACRGLHMGMGEVTRELFREANSRLNARPGSREKRSTELRNPLATFLVCAECGRAMRRIVTPDPKGGAKIERIAHPKSNRAECWAVSSTMREAVAALIGSLEEMAADIQAAIDTGGESAREDAERRAAALEAALADEGRAVGNLLRLAEKGLITDEEFAERKRASDARAAEARRRLDRARADAARAAERGETVVGIKRAVAALRGYEGRAGEANAFLKSVLSRVEYEKDPRTGEIRLGVFLR